MRTIKLHRIFFLIFALFVLTFPANAYDFKIRVVEELDSLDLQGVELKVMQGDSLVVAPVYTDGFGVAQVKNLPKGEYQ